MTRTLLVLGKELRHHCSCNSHDLLVNVWNCSSPVIDFLSGYEDLVSSGSDHFTLQGNMRLREVLTEHVVDIHKGLVDFRDTSERIQSSSFQTLCVNRLFSLQSFDYFEHKILHERFHATHFKGCAILFDKDTSYSDISVKSIHNQSVSLHRTIGTHQQCFCEEERYCQEHYSDSSCNYDFSRH